MTMQPVSIVDGFARLISTVAKPTVRCTPLAVWGRAPQASRSLLEGNFCASFFELFLDRFGFFLRNAFLDHFGSAFD